MKRIISLFGIAILLVNISYTQESAQRVFIGTLFTSAKFVTQESFKPASEMPEYVRSWNSQQIKEFSKYNIKEALRLSKLHIDIDPTKTLNETLDYTKAFAGKTKEVTKEQLNEVIQDLDLEGYEGYFAICYVVASFDKINQEATIWFTAIDCNTKKVEFAEKFVTKPSGFGLRNYWLNCFYEMIKEIKKDRYYEWSK
jgi:hypothetical protein